MTPAAVRTPFTSAMHDFLMQSPETDSTLRRACMAVAVVMRRERIDNAWQPWRWTLADVVPDEDGFGRRPRLLFKDECEERWLHPGLKVELHLWKRGRLLPECDDAASLFLGGPANGRGGGAG